MEMFPRLTLIGTGFFSKSKQLTINLKLITQSHKIKKVFWKRWNQKWPFFFFNWPFSNNCSCKLFGQCCHVKLDMEKIDGQLSDQPFWIIIILYQIRNQQSWKPRATISSHLSAQVHHINLFTSKFCFSKTYFLKLSASHSKNNVWNLFILFIL